jgi:acyl dehydratase
VAAPAGVDVLPDHRVRARNLSRYSANRIHDDAVARTLGYAGGLVAGTTVYAYMTCPLVAAWGLEWLTRGTASVRFLRPVYDGDEVCVRARVVGRSGSAAAGEIALEVKAFTSREGTATVVAAGIAGLAWGAPVLTPDPHEYPAAPLPTARPAATAELLAGLDPFGSPVLVSDERELAQYVEEVEDPLAHYGLARVGDRLTTRGRVVGVSQRKGRQYVDLDVLVVADDSRPLVHVRHMAIYQLSQAG